MQIDIFLVLLPLVINGNVICTHTTLYTMILRFYLPPATKTVKSSDIQRVEGVAEGWQRWQKRREKCSKNGVFRNLYSLYVVEKVILVADNTILGIHKIDKWIWQYRLVDSAISTCRFFAMLKRGIRTLWTRSFHTLWDERSIGMGQPSQQLWNTRVQRASSCQ